MRVRNRLERLEKILPPPPPPTPEERQEQRRSHAVSDRFINQLDQAFALLSEPERGLVQGALVEYLECDGGPLRQWLGDLRVGRCRVPQLTAETTRQVTLCWMHPEAGDAMVCNRCGLECPRCPGRVLPMQHQPDRTKLADLPQRGTWPRYFPDCPGCGDTTRDRDWPHLVDGKSPPWKALDGWMRGKGERR